MVKPFRDVGETGKPGRGRMPNRPAVGTRDSERAAGPLAGSNPAVPLTLAINISDVGRKLSVYVRSEAVLVRRWTVDRRKRQDGPVFPIWLTWPQPITGVEVWGWLMEKAKSDDPEWNVYSHFEAVPTDEKPPTEGGT